MGSTKELFTSKMAVLLSSRLNNGLMHGDLMAVQHADYRAPAAAQCSASAVRLLLSTRNVSDYDRFD